MSLRIIILGIAIVVAAFIGATLLMNLLWPSSLQEGRPQLVAVPPLPPLAGTSTVLAPAAVAMSAIRDALEAQAPRNLTGRPQNPVSQLLQAAELNFAITRGPLSVTGRPDGLVVSTALTGTFQARGTLTGAAGAVGLAPAGRQGHVAHQLAVQAQPVLPGQQPVASVHHVQLGPDLRRLPVDGTGHNQLVELLHAPAALHELAGEPVEQFGMAGRLALVAEILQGSDDAAPEESRPLTIHGHSTGQRVVW